jgi:hypothetical protein
MSLSAFDTLRARHPDAQAAIGELERRVAETLRRDPKAIIDEQILMQQLRVAAELIERWLVELVTGNVLAVRLLWRCPNGYGTSAEAGEITAFPDTIECDRCGEFHRLKESDVQVAFIASDLLAREVLTSQ